MVIKFTSKEKVATIACKFFALIDAIANKLTQSQYS